MLVTKQSRSGRWWILGQIDGRRFSPAGPYNTKADAESDRRGIERFYTHEQAYTPKRWAKH